MRLGNRARCSILQHSILPRPAHKNTRFSPFPESFFASKASRRRLQYEVAYAIIIESLAPAAVWKTLCRHGRRTARRKPDRAHMTKVATDMGLKVKQDKPGNLLIKPRHQRPGEGRTALPAGPPGHGL